MARLHERATSPCTCWRIRRKGPSGRCSSAEIRLTPPRPRSASQCAKLQPSGVSFSRSTFVVSSDESRTRLPVTNQPGSANRRWMATKSGRSNAVPIQKNTISAARNQYRSVANFSGAKPRSACQTCLSRCAIFGFQSRSIGRWPHSSRRRPPRPQNPYQSAGRAIAVPHRGHPRDYRW